MKSPETLVSIVIAAHNEGDNVRRTVESVLANTDQPPFEIVLVDDGSSDASFDFLYEGAHRTDRRLRTFRYDQSAGCTRARHQGVRLARGTHIQFLDAHMAVPPGWLSKMAAAQQRWGPFAIVGADVTSLKESAWTINQPMGGVLIINEDFSFVWQDPPYPTGLVPTVGGACMLMPRQFYFQAGGFDLGLRRWGCGFIDLTMKAYAAGGACYHEPDVVVGHLFRDKFTYPVSHRDVNYNKLRVGYVHLPDGAFRCFVDRLQTQAGFAGAWKDFRADLPELEHRRRAQQAASRRDPGFFTRMFLPGLCPDQTQSTAGKIQP
jgi:glycosyltransferase involved in cell wall biosynthesis